MQSEVVIYHDDSAESPREYENLGTIVHWHPSYSVGDVYQRKDDYNGPEEHLEGKGDILYLPVYLYDHGGLALSCGSFVGRAHHAEWDSGQVGWIYAEKSKIREWFQVKRITKKIEQRVYDCFNAEVEEFSDYVQGNVYGFKIFDITECECCEQETERQEADSCWGFIGSDPETNGMFDHIPEELHSATKAAFDKVVYR